MDKIVSAPSSTNWDRSDQYELGKKPEDFSPLTAQQAQELRRNNPSVSPWGVVAGQLIVGVLVAGLSGFLTGKVNVFWSAGYGALSVALPAAVFARGLTGRLASINPGAAVFGFFLWEMVKIGLTVAMLFAAPRLISELSWPAMLVGLVVTIKVYWVALAFKKKNVKEPKS